MDGPVCQKCGKGLSLIPEGLMRCECCDKWCKPIRATADTNEEETYRVASAQAAVVGATSIAVMTLAGDVKFFYEDKHPMTAGDLHAFAIGTWDMPMGRDTAIVHSVQGILDDTDIIPEDAEGSGSAVIQAVLHSDLKADVKSGKQKTRLHTGGNNPEYTLHVTMLCDACLWLIKYPQIRDRNR